MAYTHKLLLIEDNPDELAVLDEMLTDHQYAVFGALTGREGLTALTHFTPDLVILDLRLPDINGPDMLHRIRRQSNVPVLVLSGEYREREKVRALEAGADDYLTKPFHPAELLARLIAILRRSRRENAHKETLQVGNLRVDIARRQVTLNGRNVHLTPIEYTILTTLIQHKGATVSYETLLKEVWGASYQKDHAVLRVNISRLRQKLERHTRHRTNYIKTVPRQGYRIQE